jgi:hypothetical protein
VAENANEGSEKCSEILKQRVMVDAPVMNFMKIGKYLRNHARFSRNKGDSAMHPGYMLEKAIPVNLLYFVCKKFAIIIKQSLESLYALAPMKP